MTVHSDQKIYDLIIKFEEELFLQGIPPQGRHLRVPSQVMNALGWQSFVLAGSGKPELLTRIQTLHSSFYRTKDTAQGPLHVGIYEFKGIVAKIEIPVIFGSISFNPYMWSDLTDFQMRWLCADETRTAAYLSTFCDIMDFGRSIIPMADVNLPPKESRNYLSTARSHLISATTLVSENLGLRGCTQSALLGAEFSLKAVLQSIGKSESELRKIGHNLKKAVEDISQSNYVIDSTGLFDVIDKLPKYVADRYSTCDVPLAL